LVGPPENEEGGHRKRVMSISPSEKKKRREKREGREGKKKYSKRRERKGTLKPTKVPRKRMAQRVTPPF
jgi:hypothetical protein